MTYSTLIYYYVFCTPMLQHYFTVDRRRDLFCVRLTYAEQWQRCQSHLSVVLVLVIFRGPVVCRIWYRIGILKTKDTKMISTNTFWSTMIYIRRRYTKCRRLHLSRNTRTTVSVFVNHRAICNSPYEEIKLDLHTYNFISLNCYCLNSYNTIYER
jgi:hypothetical protein